MKDSLEKLGDDYGLTPEGVRHAIETYQKIIYEITGGRLSKLTYDADYILEAMSESKLDKQNMMHTVCLRCGEHAISIPFGLDGISYTHYSYCKNCLRKGIKLLKAKDEADELKGGK